MTRNKKRPGPNTNEKSIEPRLCNLKTNTQIIAPHTREEWAARITHLYKNTVSAIITVGQELIAAKASLRHGQFLPMIRRDLPFKERTAQRFMQIAGHQVLSTASYWTYLPVSIGSLVELAKWEPDDLLNAIQRGNIRPDSDMVTLLFMRDLSSLQIPKAAEPKNEAQQRPSLAVVVPASDDCTVVPRGHVFSDPRKGASAAFDSLEPGTTGRRGQNLPIDANFEEVKLKEQEDSKVLSALKAAWSSATATDQAAFLRWIESEHPS
jgi:hypothetical protein